MKLSVVFVQLQMQDRTTKHTVDLSIITKVYFVVFYWKNNNKITVTESNYFQTIQTPNFDL